MARNTILIVEDDQVVRRAMEAILSAAGHRVRTADTCSSGLALALEELPELLVLDISLPDGTGWSLLESIHNARPHENFKVIVASSNQITRGQLRKYRVDIFIAKPFDMAYLAESVGQLLDSIS